MPAVLAPRRCSLQLEGALARELIALAHAIQVAGACNRADAGTRKAEAVIQVCRAAIRILGARCRCTVIVKPGAGGSSWTAYRWGRLFPINSGRLDLFDEHAGRTTG